MSDTIKKDGKVYISSEDVPADLDQSGYEALTWVEIGGLVSMPEIGIETNMVTRSKIKDNVNSKQKGFSDAGDGEIEVCPDHDDLGQIELLEAGATSYRFARGFKVESNDKLNATGTNTIRYSRGPVAGPRLNGGGGEDFDNDMYSIGFEQEPVIVKATAGV